MSPEPKADPLREIVEGFIQEVGRAVQSKKRTGQIVPYHGDFANAPPSVLIALEWWTKRFQEKLDGK